MSVFLSIVIPTKKSRLDHTVVQAVEGALAIEAKDIEVIVHVDVDCKESPLDLKKIVTDKRFKYIEYPQPLPMTANWEEAMNHARGTYVLYCGDDDIVAPAVYDVARWAEQNDLDNVIHTGKAIYFWPTYADPKRAGTFKMLKYTGKAIFPDIEKVRRTNSRGPKMSLYRYQPEVYLGIMRRSVIDTMKAKTGKCFGSVIPDLYFAFAVAPFIKKYCLLDYPFSLAGHSGKANASRFVKKVMHEQEDQFIQYEWPGILPHIGDFVSFYADSKYQAYRDSGQNDLTANIDIPLAFANCLFNAPHTGSKTRKLLGQYNRSMEVRAVWKPWGYVVLAAKLKQVLLQRINLKMPFILQIYDRRNNWIHKRRPFRRVVCTDIREALAKVLDTAPQLGLG